MIVIDVGCATYGGDESINALVNEFHPRFLWGYDPAMEPNQYVIGETLVDVVQAAVWTFDGEINFRVAGLGGQVHEKGEKVTCLDIVGVIEAAKEQFDDIVVKFDCEGAEYQLIPRLVSENLDLEITTCLVEWHCQACQMGIWNQDMHREGCPADKAAWVARRDEMQASLRCEVRPWLL